MSTARDAERFWTKVADGPDGCWEWRGALSKGGYGNFEYKGSTWRAHRLSYVWLIGEIPAGLTLDHLCGHTWCVNPYHLDPVPASVNALRGNSPTVLISKGTACSWGHEYTPENTYMVPGYNRRVCRTCRRGQSRARRLRRRVA